MTPAQIISEARYIANDNDPNTLYRQEDAELLEYVNTGLKEMAIFMPQMFSEVGDFTCTVSTVEQTLSFTNAIKLLDVVSVKNGDSVTMFDRRTRDQFDRSWRTGSEGTTRQWSPKEGDPLTFYVDRPVPSGGQTLVVQYVRNPSVYALTDTITDVPDSMRPALVDYVLYKAESKDDENVLNGRASAFYAAFKQKIGVIENGA